MTDNQNPITSEQNAQASSSSVPNSKESLQNESKIPMEVPGPSHREPQDPRHVRGDETTG